MEQGAAAGGIRGRRARLDADQWLGKATAVQIGADGGEVAKGAAGQGRRRPGRPASVRQGPSRGRGRRRGSLVLRCSSRKPGAEKARDNMVGCQ
jgi:hypothetical protein